MGKGAFSNCELDEFILPPGIEEIDPSAFDYPIWPNVAWPGPPSVIPEVGMAFSADSRILLHYFFSDETVVIPAHTEVIGRRAFRKGDYMSIEFESGTKLREIAEKAFSGCEKLKSFTVPSSVETIGDRCFEYCSHMATITFEEISRLKRIGERAFFRCRLGSITIPASVEEIDGSAFVGCPLLVIRVSAGSRNFKIEGDLLTTADGARIVRYIGRDREVTVPMQIDVLGKSSFESCNHVERVVFENGSKLRQIGPSAFSWSAFLTNIAIPASVESIEDSAFERCDGLEECLISNNAVLVKIGKKAFADCRSLGSFSVPKTVRELGEGCFLRCGPLRLLIFGSDEHLKSIMGVMNLEKALESIGFADLSSLFQIEVNQEEASQEGINLSFPGWVSIGDNGSTMVLTRATK
jgi:hypothetical protein